MAYAMAIDDLERTITNPLIIVSLDVDIALMLTLVNSTYIVPQS